MNRKKDGKFATGNKCGQGRPPRATETTYLNVVMDKCPVETWGEIVETAVVDAKDGDPKAREWLGKLLIGVTNQPAPSLVSVHLEQISEYDPVMLAHGKQIESEFVDQLLNSGAYENAKKELLE